MFLNTQDDIKEFEKLKKLVRWPFGYNGPSFSKIYSNLDKAVGHLEDMKRFLKKIFLI